MDVKPLYHHLGIEDVVRREWVKMVDYEALGKYTDGKDNLKNLVTERDALLSNLMEISQNAHVSSSDFVADLDIDQAQVIVAQLTKLTSTIHVLVRDINSNAEKSGKPPVEIKILGKLNPA
jgi:hypothetical protein